MAEGAKSSWLRRPLSHDLGSTRTLVTSLRPWIRRFSMIISAWWLRTNGEFTWEEIKRKPENLKNGQLLSGCGFVQSITPPSLFRDRRIKIQKLINQKIPHFYFEGMVRGYGQYCRLTAALLQATKPNIIMTLFGFDLSIFYVVFLFQPSTASTPLTYMFCIARISRKRWYSTKNHCLSCKIFIMKKFF